MKYNYYVDGFKTTHTTFVYYLCHAIAYANNKEVDKDVRKIANAKIVFSRNLLRFNEIKKVSWTAPCPPYDELNFEITKAE